MTPERIRAWHAERLMTSDDVNWVRCVRVVGSEVRRRRVLRGWTATDLARRAGMAQQHISGIELETRACGLRVAARLALELGCRIDDLIVRELNGQGEGKSHG